MKDNQVSMAQEIILKKTQNFLSENKLKGSDYLKVELEEISRIKHCLGSADGKYNRALERSLATKRNTVLKDISKDFMSKFSQYDDIGILMKALRITEDTPKYCSNIFIESRNEISKRPIVEYFLHIYLGKELPVLDKEEILKIKDMEYQFNDLLIPETDDSN